MRGQTTLDFATGVSVFLFTIVFVFAFVPGTLQPFTNSAQAETAGSDKVADLIVKDLLAEPGEPYVLDGACTAALMSDGPGTGCGFDGANLSARLDIDNSQYVNVTMDGDPAGSGPERLCWDEDNDQVVGSSDADCDSSDVELVTGDNVPENSNSVVTSRRIVDIEGVTATVQVRLW